MADPELAPAGEYSMQAINQIVGFKNIEPNMVIFLYNVEV